MPTTTTQTKTPLLDRLFDYVAEEHPRSLRGLNEARDQDPKRFAAIAELAVDLLVLIQVPLGTFGGVVGGEPLGQRHQDLE